MKKYLKEIIVIAVEFLFLYLFPLAPLGDKTAHLILLLVITLLVGTVGCAVSNKKIKFLFPIASTILLIPTMFIYYNDSHLGYIAWIFVFGLLGTILGSLIYGIVVLFKKFILKKNA